MANQQAERVRGMLAAAAVVAAAGTILSLRMVRTVTEMAARPVPAADVQTLSSFLSPLSDSGSLAQVGRGTMVVARDPFAPQRAAGRSTGPDTADARSKSGDAGRWVVSTILLEGSRRSAIVNNVWVTIGDGVGEGAKISAIEPDHVVVTDAKGTRHVVSIQGGV